MKTASPQSVATKLMSIVDNLFCQSVNFSGKKIFVIHNVFYVAAVRRRDHKEFVRQERGDFVIKLFFNVRFLFILCAAQNDVDFLAVLLPHFKHGQRPLDVLNLEAGVEHSADKNGVGDFAHVR